MVGKIMAGSEIKGYHVLLTGDNKILTDEADKTKEKMYALKLLNFTAYNVIILTQEDMVWFHIIEEAKTKYNKYWDARLAWKKHQEILI